jgi:hypothetical protein
LAHGGRLLEGVGSGPEDVARGPDGLLYTGLDDGRMDVALKREKVEVEGDPRLSYYFSAGGTGTSGPTCYLYSLRTDLTPSARSGRSSWLPALHSGEGT